MSLLSIEGCPNVPVADARLAEALLRAGLQHLRVEHVLVTSHEQAQALGFRGSPTVLIDGVDPFAGDAPAAFGLTCRVYRTGSGLNGAPSVEALTAALRGRN